jgi:hypothetical protein
MSDQQENNDIEALPDDVEERLQKEEDVGKGLEDEEAPPVENLEQPKKEAEEKVEVAEGGQDLKVLPENEEEEKEEILLTTPKKKPKTSKAKPFKINHEINLTDLSKHLEKQSTQTNKIIQMLQPIQRQIKSAEKQPALIKQLQSQLKQVQKQVSQIQKGISITKTKKKKR